MEIKFFSTNKDNKNKDRLCNSQNIAVLLNPYLSENDKIMFLSGNYTLRSLGIIYEYSVTNFEMLAKWDSENSVFDINYWGE